MPIFLSFELEYFIHNQVLFTNKLHDHNISIPIANVNSFALETQGMFIYPFLLHTMKAEFYNYSNNNKNNSNVFALLK